MTPLASVSDVQARLPGSVTVEPIRILALLQDASAAIRSYTKQTFTIQQTTIGVRPIGYRLRLPQRPVISVDSITVVLPGTTEPVAVPGWYWDGSNEVWLTFGDLIINLSEELTGLLEWQTPEYAVTYHHGYPEVPDDVVGVVCSMVTRVSTAPGLGGVVSESVGEYSYRLSDAAAQGPMTLTQSEKDTLSSYRIRKASTTELRW